MNMILAMLVAFLWGTTYAVTQYTLSGWPPLLLGALRALPAGLLLLMLKPNLPRGNQWMILLRLGSINIALFFSLLFVMSQTLPSTISGLGMIYVPVFAMLFHWLVYKKRATKAQVISAILLIALAWRLFDPQQMQFSDIGLLALLGAIACIVVGGNLTKSLSTNIHWWTVLSWQLILGGALLALLATLQALFIPAPYSAALHNITQLNLLGLLWLIVFNTALAYGLYVWLLKRMSVVEFTFAGIGNPIAGVTMGLLLLEESFSSNQYLLMLAMLIVSLCAPMLNHFYLSRQKRVPALCYS